MRFKNKVALVTGSGGGIGRAIALAFAREGAIVVVSDIIQEKIDGVVNEIRSLGREVLGIKADITKSEDVKKMVTTILEKHGKVDILVNNAGGAAKKLVGHSPETFQDSSEEIWRKVIDLNLLGVLICSHAVIKNMIDRKSGKIINISSGSGLFGARGPGAIDYSAAKAGVIGFTKALAIEVGKYGINVNCVVPGSTETEGFYLTRGLTKDEAKEKIEGYAERNILGRIGQPEDIAKAVLYLASNDSDFITAQYICVDGGRL